jgi:hypothetical protein
MMRTEAVMTRAIASFCFTCATFAILASGCDGKRRDWDSCYTEPCADGGVCTSDHRCVPVPVRLDGGALDGAARRDASPLVDTPALDTMRTDLGDDAPPPVDAAIDVERDVAMVDAPLPVDVAVDLAVDTFAPDAPGTCAMDDDCLDPGLPYCVDRVCVACKTGTQCKGTTPICSAAHTCVSCADVDAGCASPTPACQPASGRCVECLGDGDCIASPEKSFCVAGACAGCGASAADACAKRDPSKPACVAAGACVECTSSAHCTVASKPICDTTAHTCTRCASDSECEALPGGPGVCMGQDGHCATDAETLYVGSTGDVHCSDSGTPGSSTTPYCSLQLAVTAARTRGVPLIVANGSLTGGFLGVTLGAPLTVVGKGAVITPSPGADGISIVGGDLTLRGITVRGSAANATGIGINAAPTSGNAVVLRMEGCTVTDNPGGGILLNGAGFVIENTTISRNGPNPTVWGGISVQNPPAAGPTTFSQVTISDNKQVGLVCGSSLAATHAGAGVLAKGNAGGIEISSVCGIVACAEGSEGCGAR